MRVITRFKIVFYLCFLLVSSNVTAQSQLYPQNFDLHEVKLLDSPYKQAMDKNIEVLLAYDTDRLLAPFVRQAGLSATTDASSKYYQWEIKHPNFENWGWNPSFALDGHVGGHYLTALSLAYSANHDETVRTQLKTRIDYMVSVFKDCQDVYDNNAEGLYGFIGGLPDNTIWTELYKGNASQIQLRGAWVPYYVIHKAYSGLRDAYLYAGNETAKECFRKLCDWGINVVATFDNERMQREVLYNEHGGINEVYVDAYKLFGDIKYLDAAKKYSHAEMVNGMQDGYSESFLDHKHANTQVPKYIGFERIAQEDASATTCKHAALNFWDDVANHRTVCIGGNSVDEHFLAKDKSENYIHRPDGPESCNTNNMLKLSENLFCDTHEAQYIDFYEKAMLNHILSTQDPTTGGYVYFTSLRPQSYRIYSQVNSAMWCCVGTGMENHSKYGHFIYSHTEDNSTLFINLFVASELNSTNFAVKQETSFPYTTSSKITVNKAGTYTIAVRHPAWTADGYSVKVNNSDATGSVVKGDASFVNINRIWNVGDVIDVTLPMELTISECPNYTDYVAFHYGPVLLAAQTTGTDSGEANYEDLLNEYAGEGRMDHSPGVMGIQKNLTSAPMILCEREDVLSRVTVKDAANLLFEVDATRDNSEWTTMELKPFYSIHNARYIVYWNQQTEEEYANSDLAQEEAEAIALEARTLDNVLTGEQQSEAGHALEATDPASKGVANGEYYRDAWNSAYFQYTLDTKNTSENVSLRCRFNINDKGRMCTIYIDGKKLRNITIPESVSGADAKGFYNVEYPISASLLKDDLDNVKTSINVKFQASSSTPAPGLYNLRLLKDYTGPQYYTFQSPEWITGDEARVPQANITYDSNNNAISVTATGDNNICLQLNPNLSDDYYIESTEKYLLVKGSDLSSATNASFLWFLNGANNGTSIAPNYVVKADDGDLIIIWDITKTGLNNGTPEGDIIISKGSGDKITLFGLTSSNASGTSIIKDINFYSPSDAVETYSTLSFLSEDAYDTTKDTQLLLKSATTNAQGAIKYVYNGSFAFIELINSAFSTDDIKGYEIDFATPVPISGSYRFVLNGWDGDNAGVYNFQQNDLNISGSFIAAVNNNTDFAFANKTINNLWIQYLWGDDNNMILDLEGLYLVKNDDSKEEPLYNLSASGLSIYHTDFIANASGQNICNMTNVLVEGYDYIRIELNKPSSAGWKMTYDGNLFNIPAGETEIILPVTTAYSTLQNLRIYTEASDFPSSLDVAGIYLTNNSGEPPVLTDPNDSYFPLTNIGVDVTIWDDGGTRPNSFDEATKTFTFGSNYNSVGWSYLSGVDFSDYKYLVVEFNEKPTNYIEPRIRNNDMILVPINNSIKNLDEYVIDLNGDFKIDGQDTYTNYTFNNVSQFYFWNSWEEANATISIKKAYLTNGSETSIEQNTVNKDSENKIVDVYTIMGIKIRSQVERDEATKNLPLGIYIVGNKKVIVK